MDSSSIFDTLLDLPLFRGVSRQRIGDIAGKAKFHFLKYLPDTEVISEGDKCTHLKFILSGDVRLTLTDHKGRFSVSQTLSGPDVILPDYLFGRATHYPCSAKAITAVSIMQIEKADYLQILTMDPVFMLNYLNYLSMNAQKAVEGILSLGNGGVDARIAFWIISLTQPTGKNIEMNERHRDLYTIFGVQRSSFMATLKTMQEEGLIEFDSHTIRITDRRRLLNLLLTHPE